MPAGEHGRIVDQRNNKRYRLDAAVSFSWHADATDLFGEGNTRDISLHGVFVVTDREVPLGTAVQLKVSLPSLRVARSGIFLRGKGKIIRVEEKGFAAVADMSFRIQFPDGATRYEGIQKRVGVGQRNPRSCVSI